GEQPARKVTALRVRDGRRDVGDLLADREHRQMGPQRAPHPPQEQALEAIDRGASHPRTPAVATLEMNARWKSRKTTSAGTATAVIAANTTTLDPLCPACSVTRPSGSVMCSSVLMKISGPK